MSGLKDLTSRLTSTLGCMYPAYLLQSVYNVSVKLDVHVLYTRCENTIRGKGVIAVFLMLFLDILVANILGIRRFHD